MARLLSFENANLFPEILVVGVARVLFGEEGAGQAITRHIRHFRRIYVEIWHHCVEFVLVLVGYEVIRSRICMHILELVFVQMIIVEQRIDHQVKHVVDHPRQQALEQVVALLEARVCVHLYEVCVQLLVHYEVVAEELKCIFLGAEFGLDRFEGIADVFDHGLPELII